MQEAGTGIRVATLVAVLAYAIPASAGAATITVDTADGTAAVDDACSLPEAIAASNKDQRQDGCRPGDGADRIAFDIAGSALIQPTTQLPDVKKQVTIDGTTEPDFAGEPVVNLDGGGVVATGLEPTADRVVIKGLAVTNFFAEGLRINGDANKIVGNVIGLDPAGAEQGNGVGISLEGERNQVGGAPAAARNVISANGFGGGVLSLGNANRIEGNYIGLAPDGATGEGNDGHGISASGNDTRIIGNVSSDNSGDGVRLTGGRQLVRGNLLGTDAAGELGLDNDIGVFVGAKRSTIGGTKAAHRNVISGNSDEGLVIDNDGGVGRNRVLGNYIGTDVDGQSDLGNDEEAVRISESRLNVIGGDEPDEANVLSGNARGVIIGLVTEPADENVVSGNIIGLDADSEDPIPNTAFGVEMDTRAHDNVIGGLRKGEGNIISGNGGDGVNVIGPAAADNSILRNSIFANGGEGIDLAADGVTLNDVVFPQDADAGPNGLQNFPEIEGVNAEREFVDLKLESTPDRFFRIEVFLSPEPDGTAFGEGKRFITGVSAIHTEEDGLADLRVHLRPWPAGKFLTATATEVDPGDDHNPGSTSEFSTAIELLPP